MNEYLSGSMYEWMFEWWVDAWIHGQMCGLMDYEWIGWMDGHFFDRYVCVCVDGRMNRYVDG